MTPVVKRLLIANVACFILRWLMGFSYEVVGNQLIPYYWMDRYFGLVPALVISKLYLWQFVTYMFLQGGIIHLLFNMFVLYMFGRDVEDAFGSRRFAIFYFFCGIGAGLCSYIFYSGFVPIIGASGAVFGLLVAFGMLFPERVVTLLLFFVLPVSMRAKHLVIIFVGVEVLFIMNSAPSGIAHFAHLGGALCGYLYMKNFGHIRSWLELRRDRRPRRRTLRDEEYDCAALRERVDVILDKISRYGFSSLNENEKEILRRAKDEY